MKLICGKCRAPLEKKKTTFRYLKYEVSEEVLCCPVCGQVYLDEELGRQVEKHLKKKDIV